MRCATRVEYSRGVQSEDRPEKECQGATGLQTGGQLRCSSPLNLLTHVMVHWLLLPICILYGEVKCLVYTSPTFPFKFLFLFEI